MHSEYAIIPIISAFSWLIIIFKYKREVYMVRIITGLLGKPKGKSGDYVYRIINGVPFASIRPKKYNASQSDSSIANRGRFGIAIQFAKYVNSIPELSQIWKYAKIKGYTSFNKLLKYNIKSIHEGFLTTSNIITPNLSTSFAGIENISFDGKTIKFKINLNNNAEVPEINSPFLIYAVIAFQNPKPRNKVPISIIHISQEITFAEIESTNELQLNLNASQKKLLLKYKSCIIYLTAILDLPVPKVGIYSATFAQLFPLTQPKKEAANN